MPGTPTIPSLVNVPSPQSTNANAAQDPNAGDSLYELIVKMQWPLFNNVTLNAGGFLYGSYVDNVTAHAGGGKANAYPLMAELSRITTVATAGDSVLLPPSASGIDVYVVNHGANAVQVYGAGTDTIDDVATGTGVSQMPNSSVLYSCSTTGAWYTEGLATGFVRGSPLSTSSYTDGIVASATQTQAAGTLLTTLLNRIATCATTGNAVTLMASAAGLVITVTNAGANSCNIFPSAAGTGTETINSLAANAAFALGAGKSCTFNCYTAGQWHTIPLVP